MKKHFFSLVNLVAFLSLIPFSTHAVEEEAELKPIVVSATRFPGEKADTAASIIVITRKEIQDSGAVHLVEVLRGRGGMQISDLYGDGSRTTVSMRGFGGNAAANTLILVDGRRLNNSDLGAPDLNSIDLKDVERVEIIRGSAGVLYGDQAVGGVVNIITRRATDFSVDITQAISSYRGRNSSFSVSDRFSTGTSYRVSGAYRETDNYRDNNEQDYANLFARFEQEFSRGDLFIDLQGTREDLRLPGALFNDEIDADRKQTLNPDDFLDTDTDATRVGGTMDLSDSWMIQAEFTTRKAETEGFLSVGGFGSPLSSGQRHHSINPRLQGRIPLKSGELLMTLGADLEWTEYEIESAAFGITEDNQQVQNVYLLGRIPLVNALSLGLGARHARVKDHLKVFPTFGADIDKNLKDAVTVAEAGLYFAPTKNWQWFARLDENYRFAKADENSFPPPGVVGLNTQTGLSKEVGLEWHADKMNGSLVVYQLDLQDEIDFDPFFFTNNNLDDTQRRGVILDADRQFSPAISFSGAYSYTDAKFTNGPFKNEDVPFVARHGVRLSGQYSRGPWRTNLEMQSISNRRAIGDYDGEVQKLSGSTVWNLFLKFQGEGWDAGFKVNNLTDKKYRSQAASSFNPFPVAETAFFPAPERNYGFNLTYHID